MTERNGYFSYIEHKPFNFFLNLWLCLYACNYFCIEVYVLTYLYMETKQIYVFLKLFVQFISLKIIFCVWGCFYVIIFLFVCVSLFNILVCFLCICTRVETQNNYSMIICIFIHLSIRLLFSMSNLNFFLLFFWFFLKIKLVW